MPRPRPRVSTAVLILVATLVLATIGLADYLQEDSMLRDWLRRVTESWRGTRPIDRALERLMGR